MADMIGNAEIKKVLLVDDSRTSRMIIRQCLEIIGLQGKTFIEADNGRDAMEFLKRNSFDLVVSDLNMPLVDGEILLAEIRNNPQWSHIPFIMVTSSSNDAREKKLRQLGANAVISKPLNPMAMSLAWKSISGGQNE
jgi:two-component system, chemotaxis family, chemotaxis protein CheY